jgi:alanine dehydrogenase
VIILDINVDRLRHLAEVMPANVCTLYSNAYNVRDMLQEADLLIGAVLISGARAPVLVSRSDLKLMKPGSVIVDVAVDQGGCVETTRPTTHSNPTYIEEGVVHYCVANMPGAVGRTSTYALTNVTLPYALQIADLGWRKAAAQNPALAAGVNVAGGKITHEAVAQSFSLSATPLAGLLG